MFENVIGQGAALQLSADIEAQRLPQALLFQGPPLSGKGTAALEMARALSCEREGAPWNCACQHCAHHRLLSHPDLLITGPRPFLPEIYAAEAAFLKENIPATRTLFVRSVKKLLMRFSPLLVEGDTRIVKLNPVLESIHGDLEEWAVRAASAAAEPAHQEPFALERDGEEPAAEAAAAKNTALQKLTASVIKNAATLESEGISAAIPIAHIRAASYWLHTAPQGKKKIFIIENAEHTQDAARNSLLKTLEEPPLNTFIILTSARPRMLLPTILSRLRPYLFVKREAADENGVIRRVFRTEDETPLDVFFERFSQVQNDTLRGASALWVASVASRAAQNLRRAGKALPAELVALGTYSAGLAEEHGSRPKDGGGRPIVELSAVLPLVMEKMGGFTERQSFSRFLSESNNIVLRGFFAGTCSPRAVAALEHWRHHTRELRTAVEVFNLAKPAAFERFFLDCAASISGNPVLINGGMINGAAL
jgi:DNA polymerase-3 subunit gamma/tau